MIDISIHALLAESDFPLLVIRFPIPRFLSTLSLRRATLKSRLNKKLLRFLSTLSLRRATEIQLEFNSLESISIHALLAESDAPSQHLCSSNKNFYPRSPCGERRVNEDRYGQQY